MTSYIIRPLGEDDLDPVARLGCRTIEHPWSREQVAAELKIDHGVQLVAVDRIITGYVFFRWFEREAELFQLAVLPERRRQGVASALLREGLTLLAGFGVERCFLEVRERNQAARLLYERVGFTAVGRRRKYYVKPTEDAVIMEKSWR